MNSKIPVFAAIMFGIAFMNASALTKQQARDFFTNHIALSHAFDTSLADLYSPSAVITTDRINEDGSRSELRMTGLQLRQLLVMVMATAKEQGDVSEFSNVRIELKKGQARITAQRYSTIKCYDDNEYYMVVTPDDRGQLRIVEEHSFSYAMSQCAGKGTQELQKFFKAEIRRVEPFLPAKIDDDTRMEDISYSSDTLSQKFIVSTMTHSELIASNFEQLMKPIIAKQLCATANYRKLLEMGGILKYIYHSKDGDHVCSIVIGKDACQ